MNKETEEIFLLNPTENQPSSSTQKIFEVPTIALEFNLENVDDFTNVCRTCASITEFLIPIFEGEGLHNNLAEKIQEHLPIQVTEQDALPRAVCYQCAHTLLACSELAACCARADAALRARARLAAASHAPAPPPLTGQLEEQMSTAIIKEDASLKHEQQKQERLTNKQLTQNNSKADETAQECSQALKELERASEVTVGEDGKRYVSCARCHKTVSAASWRRHARGHQRQRRYRCHACGLGFHDGGNLARHARAVHARLRPHACALCRETFSRASHLQDHVRSHSDRRDFVCDVCGRASKSSAALRMHRRTHEPCRFACVQCGARFKRRGELLAHASVHTGERAHACACGRAFRLRAQLVAHAATHQQPHRSLHASPQDRGGCNDTTGPRD